MRPVAMGILVVLAGAWLVTPARGEIPGQAIYEQQCAACHQPDGAGATGLAPPLRGHLAQYLATSDGRDYLARILVSGMVGPITVDGAPFSGLMPSFAKLDDAALAAIIDYVLVSMNGAGAAIDAHAIAAARAAQPTPVGTRKMRQKIVAAAR
jgi:mono/diheme cytochrome c family protein